MGTNPFDRNQKGADNVVDHHYARLVAPLNPFQDGKWEMG